MTDEQQKPEDVDLDDLLLDEPTPEEREDRCHLDQVSPEIMTEMKQLLMKGESIRNMRMLMIAKYGETDKNVGAVYQTYRRFFNEFKRALIADKKLQEEMLNEHQESEALLSKVLEQQGDIDVPIEDKRTLLSQLHSKLAKRSALLEKRQETFIDPQIEALWTQNMREQRMVIATMSEFQDKLNVDIMDKMRAEMDVWIDMMVAVVDNTYKKVHKGADYKSEFMSRLNIDWADALKNYDHARARKAMQERKK